MEHTEYVDHGTTTDLFHLKYNGIPMADRKHKTTQIKGDIFKVDKNQLK